VGKPLVRARLAVVGLGRIGQLHAANLAGRVPRAELAGVVDTLEAVARAVGERHGVRWSTSLDELLPNADGVVIAAPSSLHVELVERAAAAGRQVFCEKPLGFGVEAATRAVAVAQRAGVALQVGFQRRFDPGWLALRASLGELGELALLRSSHRNAVSPPRELGDLFVDMAVHDLDAARWLAGEVVELRALERAGTATIALRFESGALGLIDLSRRAGYGFECSAELVGARATARTGHAVAVELLRDGAVRSPLPADHAQRHEAAYVAELEHFAAVALGAAPAGARGEDAVAALKLALLARRSAETRTPGRAAPAA
jgi:myo-inositol 2-dehydrogenase/D-chiro-inositol 1-dehydrogenase